MMEPPVRLIKLDAVRWLTVRRVLPGEYHVVETNIAEDGDPKEKETHLVALSWERPVMDVDINNRRIKHPPFSTHLLHHGIVIDLRNEDQPIFFAPNLVALKKALFKIRFGAICSGVDC